MSPNNNAAVLTSAKAHPFNVQATPYTSPSTNEIVIRNRALAINPADVGIQTQAILITRYPAILGCDVAGEVVEVGPSLKANDKPGPARFEIGDRVLGAATPLQQRDEVYHTAGFQEYVVLRLPMAAKIPDNMRFEDAAVLPLAIQTAASCLFPKEMLGLDLPSVDSTVSKSDKGTLLVWGASSSVGSCGVQLARAAGYTVVAFASKHNHELVKLAGATACFDQNDPDVVNQVVSWLQKNTSDTGKVVGAYDAISQATTIPLICDILHQCATGGIKTRNFIAAVYMEADKHARHDVEVKLNFSYVIDGTGLAETVWQYVEAGLEDGRLKCLPPADVVGKGLTDVQKAVDVLAKGVSGKKVVVSV